MWSLGLRMSWCLGTMAAANLRVPHEKFTKKKSVQVSWTALRTWSSRLWRHELCLFYCGTTCLWLRRILTVQWIWSLRHTCDFRAYAVGCCLQQSTWRRELHICCPQKRSGHVDTPQAAQCCARSGANVLMQSAGD